MSERTVLLSGSGLSQSPDPLAAIREAADAARAPLGGATPDLAILFATPHYGEEAEAIGREARRRLGARVLAGTTAQAVIGGGREVEDGPALAVFAAKLPPGVEARPFSMPPQETDEPPLDIWADALPFREGEAGVAILFADPYTIDIGALVEAVNEARPGVTLAGGIASAGQGENRLWIDDRIEDGGAAGLFLAGARGARTVVSQGCRPIGRHLVITKAKGNVIREIGGKPALEALRDTILALDEADQRLASRALQVGRVVEENRETFGRGDFIIRNPIGVDPESGAIAVADRFRPGQTIQFHVRDARTADEDLRALLGREAAGPRAGAALLFSCNGRGRRFFGTPDHDSNVLREALGDIPVAGFFCGGEFGPIGGRNFVHGYTSSIVLL